MDQLGQTEVNNKQKQVNTNVSPRADLRNINS